MLSATFLTLLPFAAATAYDYIIVGGGTSGLVVANRLSEDLCTTVLVIEAGDSVYDNVNVTDVNGYAKAFGTDIDWQFQTVKQAYTGGEAKTLRAGKALGGTSTINGLTYTRAQVEQIDAWEALGNEGWNWQSLWPYYKKSEDFQLPSVAHAEAAHLTWEKEVHGFTGPLSTGWAYSQANTSLPVTLNSTMKKLGVDWNADVNTGYMNGYSVVPRTVDQAANVREDAARAYYFPFEHRDNLHVMLNTTASRLTWASNASMPTAEGVVVNSPTGPQIVTAKKEVILSAGALVSPLLLELSGVGNPSVLTAHNIDTVVDLPTVGENLQDQMNNDVYFTVANDYSVSGGQTYTVYASASQLFGNDTAMVAAQLKEDLMAYASAVADANKNVTRAIDLLEAFMLQYTLIFDDELPLAEIIFSASSGSFLSEYWSLLPFSRGNIHIGNGNSTTGALIDPKYMMLDADVDFQVAATRFAVNAFGTPPLSHLAGTQTAPAPNVTSDAELGAWIKQNYRSNFHPVGTASMMPREKGGVVDSNLKVYGTANVRVVDASILPMQVCGHLTSTLYAMSERASDLIKNAA